VAAEADHEAQPAPPTTTRRRVRRAQRRSRSQVVSASPFRSSTSPASGGGASGAGTRSASGPGRVRGRLAAAHHRRATPPGGKTAGRSGPASRSPACTTSPPTRPGPCTGVTATSNSTSTTCRRRRLASMTCSPRSTATPPASSGDDPQGSHRHSVTPTTDNRCTPTTSVRPALLPAALQAKEKRSLDAPEPIDLPPRFDRPSAYGQWTNRFPAHLGRGVWERVASSRRTRLT
jgi:hypothetical protein